MASISENTGASAATEVLRFEKVSISYPTRSGEVPAVVNVSMVVREGESVGLVGESGCGKTTMAYAVVRHLAGGGRITSGRILFNGQDLSTFSARHLRGVRGPGIAMVYQEAGSALNPCLTIGEQLAEVLVTHSNMSWEMAHDKAAAMILEVGIPDVKRILTAYPHQLSGGQQQRVVIAMALLANPALLILDEPTTGLDVTVEAEVVDLIAGLREKFGTSLLYISHNLALIAQVCDRVAVMYSGQIIEEGNLADIYASPLHPYTRGLFRCIPDVSADKTTRPLVPISGTVTLPQDRPGGCFFNTRCPNSLTGTCDTQPVSFELMGPDWARGIRCARWKDLPGDETVRDVVNREKTPIGEEKVLRVEHLKKHYPADDRSLKALFGFGAAKVVKANEDLTFDAHRREILGIVGESGCGKSSFAKIVLGLEQATDGKVILGGTELAQLPVTNRTAEQLRSVQIVFQDPDDTLNPSYTVGSQVARALRKLNPQLARRQIDGRVRELLAMIKLPPQIMHRRPRQLSGGQKQRIAIARAFAGDPQLIVADEPVSALDVSVQAAITEVLMQIQLKRNATLVIISHDIRLVHYIADSVVVIYLGHVMEAGPTQRVFSPPYHPYTELLLSSVPTLNPNEKRRRIIANGPLPSALSPPDGCPFHTRCPRSLGEICKDREPGAQIGSEGHRIKCHIPPDELKELQSAFSW